MIDPTCSFQSKFVHYIQDREGYLAIMTLKAVAAVCHSIGHGGSDVLESAWRGACVPDAVT
jgi:hypothetical protein